MIDTGLERYYRPLFVNDVPLLDVRAPIEFARGAFPTATNLPLLNDQERSEVGCCYKALGQDAAIELGHTLISGDIKSARIEQWRYYLQKHPEAHLYCFRGGLRSRITRQWLAEQGVHVPLIPGGYKAMRTFLLKQFEALVNKREVFVLGGYTGVGKTTVINQLRGGVDLEGYAKHRGSSFGQRDEAQPSQINFENALAVDLLKKQNKTCRALVFEDEGRIIGRCAVPLELLSKIRSAPMVLLRAEFGERVNAIYQEYVCGIDNRIVLHDPEAENKQALYLLGSLQKISKRLGGSAYARIEGLMRAALAEDALSSDGRGGKLFHEQWIADLLTNYYDKMYDYQLSQKQNTRVFCGNYAEVLAWFEANN
jgi:tRNA 2-selenouridine synthase